MNQAVVVVQSARWVAARVLERVASEGAYASRALDAELSRAKLEPRDAGLATEIVYGALRVLPALDAAIAAHVTQDPQRMDGFARAALRSAAYQLAHLGRLPAHAIVDETVSIVRAKRGARVAGFVNAVLRKLASARVASPEPPRALVVPQPIAELLVASLGAARAEQFLEQRSLPPPLCLRVEQGERAALRARIQETLPDAELQDCLLSPFGLALRRAGAPRSLPGYREGLFSVQEEGSQLVGLAVGARPGERIADVCAGHGGKTTLFARQVGEAGSVLAIDRDERKLEQIAPELTRLGLPRERVSSQALDLTVGLGGLRANFDRVLVDAPCSGLGTMHRRPELLVRVGASDPERLARLQLAILQRASGLVRSGGTLAYAVCSPSAAEGGGVARAFEAECSEFERVREAQADGVPPPDADGVTRIGPWLVPAGSIACPDGYQIVLWRRSR
ncbi:MAG TPA: transcription antitermination factor NusB [Polyangiales bacterium]|nr:transcription antitermination factor NusB [Polyangiales bacterium]